MKFYTLEDISDELHISPGTARNRLAMGQDMPPSIKVGRRRLFPVTEFDKWVAHVIAPLQEAPRKDAAPFPRKPGRPRKIAQADNTR
ncbi:MAG: helix-turn-helix domain-containing protein [Acidiferrobacterales bacterium]